MGELKKIILELIGIFQELLPIEKTKMGAAADYNVALMEECMKKEQAAILQIKGLDRKREELLADNGWEGKTFRQILEELPEESRKELQPLFYKLEEEIQAFCSVNENANEIIKTNLHVVDSMAEKSGIYTGEGMGTAEKKHYTNRKA